MIITKQQLINGVTNFVLREVAPAVNDTALKTIIVAGAKLAQQSDAAADGILSNGIIKTLLPETSDGYDLTAAALVECGASPITIAPIPLILRDEKTLTFGVADVDALQRHIQEAANG